MEGKRKDPGQEKKTETQVSLNQKLQNSNIKMPLGRNIEGDREKGNTSQSNDLLLKKRSQDKESSQTEFDPAIEKRQKNDETQKTSSQLLDNEKILEENNNPEREFDMTEDEKRIINQEQQKRDKMHFEVKLLLQSGFWENDSEIYHFEEDSSYQDNKRQVSTQIKEKSIPIEQQTDPLKYQSQNNQAKKCENEREEIKKLQDQNQVKSEKIEQLLEKNHEMNETIDQLKTNNELLSSQIIEDREQNTLKVSEEQKKYKAHIEANELLLLRSSMIEYIYEKISYDLKKTTWAGLLQQKAEIEKSQTIDFDSYIEQQGMNLLNISKRGWGLLRKEKDKRNKYVHRNLDEILANEALFNKEQQHENTIVQKVFKDCFTFLQQNKAEIPKKRQW